MLLLNIEKSYLLETLKTILYFSIFRHPLKIDEIHSYTNYSDLSDTSDELQSLMNQKILTKVDEFYVYGSDLDSVVKRLKGNMQAKKALVKAKEKAGFIAKFPFVNAVGVSGSLSKGYYDDESDIDFFVITKPGKLWICRTLLMLYKKIFLFNSRKFFCINYYVSSDHLEIEEKNRFTATEIKTLIPMQGKIAFENFYIKNNWISNFFGTINTDLNGVPDIKKPIFTKTLEVILSAKLGTLVDTFFRQITIHFWKKKFKAMNKVDFGIALKSTKNISKHHPLNFQKKVIQLLNEKYEEVQHNFNIVLPKENV